MYFFYCMIDYLVLSIAYFLCDFLLFRLFYKVCDIFEACVLIFHNINFCYEKWASFSEFFTISVRYNRFAFAKTLHFMFIPLWTNKIERLKAFDSSVKHISPSKIFTLDIYINCIRRYFTQPCDAKLYVLCEQVSPEAIICYKY